MGIDTIIGPQLLGILFNTYLYGLVTNQYLSYWNYGFRDPPWLKAIVSMLFFVDTIHSAVAVCAAWFMCVTDFNNPNALSSVNWTIPFTAVATALSGLTTQTFLSHRVFQLTKHKPLTALLLVLSSTGFVCGCIAGIRSGEVKQVARLSQLTPVVICWLSLMSIVDISITVILTLVLARSKTGFRGTDTIINKLIRAAIQSGLFASMFALGDLFAFAFAPETTFYAMFAFPIGRIYTNTLLNTLNARVTFYKRDQESESGGVSVRVNCSSFVLFLIMMIQSWTTQGQTFHVRTYPLALSELEDAANPGPDKLDGRDQDTRSSSLP
ncbi:hypothetical protein B0H16DRAFT_1542943 [Mycena metata]|uniref:DUF6534 domain-containing protein n=1 Tax=Mycena metata TaxID=1033252 RepID=A0AAD7J268_9AGAR|nr:hypothetical protein B0H16DRAFT_1542943 [Mycena metata]